MLFLMLCCFPMIALVLEGVQAVVAVADAMAPVMIVAMIAVTRTVKVSVLTVVRDAVKRIVMVTANILRVKHQAHFDNIIWRRQ